MERWCRYFIALIGVTGLLMVSGCSSSDPIDEGTGPSNDTEQEEGTESGTGDDQTSSDDGTESGTGDDQTSSDDGTESGTGDDQTSSDDGTESGTGDDQTSSDDETDEGIVTNASDTVEFTFQINSTTAGEVIVVEESVDLQDIRDEIRDNNISLSSFEIIDMILRPKNAEDFIQSNSSASFVFRADWDNNGTKEGVVETNTPSSLAGDPPTFSELGSTLNLNNGLYVSSPGFSNFRSEIKDETSGATTITSKLELLEDIDSPSDLTIQVIIKITGKSQM
ncbi:MAG: hypothetical protein ACOCSE_03395 [Chitinivibrionales bacterium]